ncbi:MAG: immunity 17 family protein [Anaerolineae bacterium]|nr:immunity 17 family protein [Anaerolineae bacterium]
MSPDAAIGIILILAGLFLAAAGFFNWDWYMNMRRARMLSGLIGRTGSRIFYVVAGVILALLGVAAMVGLLPPP